MRTCNEIGFFRDLDSLIHGHGGSGIAANRVDQDQLKRGPDGRAKER
jgi:hypothetical protein